MTENLNDFPTLAADFLESDSRHPELMLPNNRAFPRTDSRTTDRLVTAIERLLENPLEGDS